MLFRSGTQPASVSIPGFKFPMIFRTRSVVKTEPGILGAYAGYAAANMNWNTFDIIETNSISKPRKFGAGEKIASSTQIYFGSEQVCGVALGMDAIKDIGNRMIPDSAQFFDSFAGGLKMAITDRALPIFDWNAGMKGNRSGDSLVPLKTSWVKMTVPWIQEMPDVVNMPWTRNVMGQGWNAFQEIGRAHV